MDKIILLQMPSFREFHWTSYSPHFLFGQPISAVWDPPRLLNTILPFSHPDGWNSTEQHVLGGKPWHIWACWAVPEEPLHWFSVHLRRGKGFAPYLSSPQLAPSMGQCLSCPKAPHKRCSLRVWRGQDHCPGPLLLIQPNMSLALLVSDSVSGLLKCNLIKQSKLLSQHSKGFSLTLAHPRFWI